MMQLPDPGHQAHSGYVPLPVGTQVQGKRRCGSAPDLRSARSGLDAVVRCLIRESSINWLFGYESSPFG